VDLTHCVGRSGSLAAVSRKDLRVIALADGVLCWGPRGIPARTFPRIPHIPRGRILATANRGMRGMRGMRGKISRKRPGFVAIARRSSGRQNASFRPTSVCPFVGVAAELVTVIKGNVSIDWMHRESARANIRRHVKRLLRKYGYPPDLQDAAVQNVFLIIIPIIWQVGCDPRHNFGVCPMAERRSTLGRPWPRGGPGPKVRNVRPHKPIF
jgi:hypothetical protein